MKKKEFNPPTSNIYERNKEWNYQWMVIPYFPWLCTWTKIVSPLWTGMVDPEKLSFTQFFVLHSCWGPFFRPTWHYFIGNPCHVNILLIFWVNLFKSQNKLIFHLITWIGLTWPVRSLLQEADSWPTFLFHQLGS